MVGWRHPKLTKLGCALAVSLAVLCVVSRPGCRKYPRATSLEAYTLMEALYTACNTKNADSLKKIGQWVDRAKADGKLSDAERDAFARIIAMGRGGQWDEAAREAFRFSEDQVGRGRLFDRPENHKHQRAAPAAPK